MMQIFGIALLASTALLLSGCLSVGPDYTEPEVETQPDWIESDGNLISSRPALDPRWWHLAFQDPVLDELTEQALAQNLTLRSAGLRVLQSQQQLAIAVGNQYPQQQQISATANRQQENNSRFNEYDVGFNMAWEVDFWGRFSRQVQSASATLDASVADYDTAMVSLVAQVAQSYLQIRTFQNRLDIAKANIAQA